ncbi:ABC transporter substrate-binding protein [Clostridium aestuarii]|uniref:ABC transporter substrate-binding protein n=1 Tax=Clostridium aestuarii TaxID=338193 RepID=A0ABT4CV14_9CLOT|nr:ABC transporter substrate-binding protein [Clostridium aestuarii]MCY6482806.1 ABC transporter substrate-binding protein [Clostridium aestuarii]
MKKKVFSLFSILCTLLLSFSLLTGCNSKKETSLKKVKLNEVVRSVFYAPMYAAINEGFFKDEGLDIDLSTGQGAETTIFKTQVL